MAVQQKATGPAIGIDLGTTYSCVAVWQHDRVEVITNDQGKRTTPSFVAFTDDERLIGDAAKNQAARNPMNTVFDAKRLIGMRYNDQSVQSDMKHWPFKVIQDPENDELMIVVRCNGVDKKFSPEHISAMILSKMKQAAEVFLEKTVTNAVVTVPAYFNDCQRRATKDAGTIAGLNVMQIINEPTAAAIAYRFEKQTATKRNVLIFDLGGGTFDVSVLVIDGEIFDVKAVSGDTHLGGEDFDNNMVTHLVREIKRIHGKDISGNARALRRLRNVCEKAKVELSSAVQTSIEVDGLFDGIDFYCKFSQAKFEDLNMELFQRCIELVKMCLMDAKMDKGAIQDVVLIGGSSRIPKVRQLLQEFFNGKKLSLSTNPEEAVAYGAAVLAANLCRNGSKKVKDMVIQDVTPLSLGDRNANGTFDVYIPRNTSIPCQRTKTATNGVDNQKNMLFEIYQGERARAIDNHFLGKFTLTGFKPAPKRMVKVDACFEIDVNGILKVSAMERRSGVQNMITITNEKGRLNRDQIDSMLEEAEKYKAKDNEFRKKAETKNALERYMYDLRNTINSSMVATNLNVDQKIKTEGAIASTINWLETHELDMTQDNDYKMMTNYLQSIWEPIIDRPYVTGTEADKTEGSTVSGTSTESKISMGIEIGKLAMDVVLAASGIQAPSITSFFQ